MNIAALQECLPKFEEELVLDRKITILGKRGVILGASRNGKVVKIYILAEGREREEFEKAEQKIHQKRKRGTLTKREELLAGLKDRPGVLGNLSGIRVNQIEYLLKSASGSGLEAFDVEGWVYLFHFMEKGLAFPTMTQQDLKEMEFISMELEGEYDTIPFGNQEREKVEAITTPLVYKIPVKKKLKLRIGAGSKRKYRFFCEQLKKEVEFYIENVQLLDSRKEMEQHLEELEKRGDVPEENLGVLRDALSHICPDGMRHIVIDYECEMASLQFYTREQLQEKTIINARATSVFLAGRSGEKKNGTHETRLKNCLLQYPVKQDTEEIEVELLSAMVTAQTPMGQALCFTQK